MLQRLVLAGVVAVALTGCGLATDYSIESADVSTLMPGWERYFSIQWSVAPEHGGVRRLDGYVYNRYGEYATNLRLLVQSLDASGNVVGQRLVWGPTGGVGGSGRASFDVRNLPAADHYDVSVWDYSFVQAP
jgi:hypothetical protein